MNNPRPGNTALLYRRVSTAHQDNSLEVQETLNDEYCRRMGLEILTSFADEDVSGSIPFADREGGRALLNSLRCFAQVAHLITAKQDRLGRDTLDTVATIRRVWEAGVTPHFPAEGGPFPRTPQNELLFEIKASVAQYERNLIRDRTRAVLRHKFNLGHLTGKVPFGFDCVYTFTSGQSITTDHALSARELAPHGPVASKILVANHPEQETIRTMHRLRSQGLTLARVADTLNSMGLRPKLGGLWQAGNVDSVLRSRHTQLVLEESPAAAAA